MAGFTINLFLPGGDAKGLRIAWISNWTGRALVAPRTELEQLLARPECANAGVYVLMGTDPDTNAPHAYVGEAEVVRERLKQHKAKEFWVLAIVFVSKDETLTKAHVRYLESRIISEAEKIGRFSLEQNKSGGSKLPESDREEMEVFLTYIRMLLPILGCELLSPTAPSASRSIAERELFCKIKGVQARGRRTPDGFVVLRGSTAIRDERPSAQRQHPFVVVLRRQLIANGSLVEHDGMLSFTRDTEFASPSAAAAVVQGGGANGLTAWRTEDGTTLKQLDQST